MNAHEAYEMRARIALDLYQNHELRHADIAKVLRLRSKEDVRKLLGRAQRMEKYRRAKARATARAWRAAAVKMNLI